MTIDEIRQLLQLFNASGVGEMEVQRGEDRLLLRRTPQGGAVAGVPAPPVPAPSAAAPPAPPAPLPEPTQQTLVKSPIVGTYYDAPSPGAPPFVNVGDSVQPGQVLCIIESMKLMNEIEAETAGVITAKLVENGRPVEYGEALFAIRPL
jgi:acetyl-CoA carboxylase biotin carboxyl carrier protein